MSLFGFGRQKPSSAQKIAELEGEMKLLSDLLTRMTEACQKKCVPTDYRESEMNKGESVCLDRCAAKYFDVHAKVSDQLRAESERGGFGM